MKLSIVTSFYNHYDRFLEGWLDAILESSELPDEIIINVSGNNYSKENIINAENRLININHKIIYTNHKSMGNARNRAVEEATSEWIMYFNVDDKVTPNCFKDIKANLSDDIDVLTGSMKWENWRKGDKTRVYNSTSDDILRGVTNDHSTYRKALWEKSKYIEYSGDVDVAFWIGLLQAGARFKYIEEVLTVHYFRPDTVFGQYTKEDKQEINRMIELWGKHGVHHAMFNDVKYQVKGDYNFAHKSDNLNLSIIIAYKKTSPSREKQKTYTIERYKKMFPTAQIILSESKAVTNNEWEGFSKSLYINLGVKKAVNEYLLLADIDVVLDKNNILQAIKNLDKYCCIIPYDTLYKLNDKESMLIYENTANEKMPKPNTSTANKVSVANRYQGVMLVKKEEFIIAGGYDERFKCWGSEDGAFIKAIETMTEKPSLRQKGTAYHLNHKINPNRQKLRDINSGIFVHEYDDAFGDKNKMLELIEKRGKNL